MGLTFKGFRQSSGLVLPPNIILPPLPSKPVLSPKSSKTLPSFSNIILLIYIYKNYIKKHFNNNYIYF